MIIDAPANGKAIDISGKTNQNRGSARSSAESYTTIASKPTSIELREPSEIMKSISSGSELVPLRIVLETQPEELHQSILDAAASMLALKKDITYRIARYQKFGQLIPVIDPTSGKNRTNPDGTTLTTPFLPQALRRQRNPAQVSAALSDNRRSIELLTAAAGTLKKY